MPIKIAPSILSADFSRLGDEIRACEAAGADIIHFDVMDGRFVPNITIGPMLVTAVRKVTSLPIDCHLMIVEPDQILAEFIKEGANMVSVHPEAGFHLHRTLGLIRSLGAKAGIALNPHTPIEMIRHVVDDIDYVLVMSVNPGFGGQAFIPSALPKIRELRAFLDNQGRKDVAIEVDGGIKPNNIAEVARAGAEWLVAGSAVFGTADYKQTIATLRQNAERALAV
jgi:ribulose-phosphate 3-epimerase